MRQEVERLKLQKVELEREKSSWQRNISQIQKNPYDFLVPPDTNIKCELLASVNSGVNQLQMSVSTNNGTAIKVKYKYINFEMLLYFHIKSWCMGYQKRCGFLYFSFDLVC